MTNLEIQNLKVGDDVGVGVFARRRQRGLKCIPIGKIRKVDGEGYITVDFPTGRPMFFTPEGTEKGYVESTGHYLIRADLAKEVNDRIDQTMDKLQSYLNRPVDS